jgi:hypothetical protein
VTTSSTSYTNGDGVSINRIEDDYHILARNVGVLDAFLDRNGYACEETGGEKWYYIRPGESVGINKHPYGATEATVWPTESNVTNIVGTHPPALVSPPEPPPEPPSIPVESDDGRQINLEEA